MSKKKLIVIIAAVLAVVIAVSVIFVVKNKDTKEEETTAEITTETSTVEDTTAVEKEENTSSVSDETEVTEEKTTVEETTVKKVVYVPDREKDTCEVLYKKEHIIGLKVKLWGTYLEEIKGSDPVVLFSAEYETTSPGENETGSYTSYNKQGYSYYFDLKTKKGYREDWSVGRSEYDATGEIFMLSDGFPEIQEKYDAVEISHEKDCVVLTLWLDKPLKYKNVDAEFELTVGENIFGTESGIGNYKFTHTWFGYDEEE